MAIKAEYTVEKGLVQTKGDASSFQITGAPLYPALQPPIVGNTSIAITVTSDHPADDAAPNAVGETDLDGKYFNIYSVDGTKWTVWFDIGGNATAYPGPADTPALNRLEVQLAANAADTEAKLATAIAAALDATADWAAAGAGAVMTATNLKVGEQLYSSVDLTQVTNLAGVDGAGDATTYSWTAVITAGSGPYTQEPGGVTRTSSTVAGSLIRMVDLEATQAGAETIIICDGVDAGNTLVKNADGTVTLATLNAANEWVVLSWSGTDWVKMHAASGV